MSFGSEAVGLARAAIDSEVLGTRFDNVASDARFREESGAFVTLSTHPGHDLRGCIGYPMPFFQLGWAIEEAARAACHDPRFPDLGEDEVDRVTVEVTVVGRDGLIIEYRGNRGLLLPQVPVEWGWDAEEYLAHLSMKAGLPPDAWTYPGVTISSFRGEIYKETSPRGDVVEG